LQTIETPIARDGLVFVSETTDEFLVSYDEMEIARARHAKGFRVYDSEALAIRSVLGQAPLAPTILADTSVLPPLSTLRVGSSTPNFQIGGTSVEVTSRVVPKPSSRDELLVEMMELYRRKTQSHKRIGIFVSAGWDSRLELACITRIAEDDDKECTFIHICDDPEDLRIVQAVAKSCNVPLDVYAATALDQEFFGSGSDYELSSKLNALPTWRPSIPRYFLASRHFLEGVDGLVVGWAPHSLKGRNYDVPLTDVPPSGGIFREVLANWGSPRPLKDTNIQRRTWRNLRTVVSGWDEAAQRDYLLWVLHNGFSYSHRNWVDITPEITQVNNDPLLLSRFMGLQPDEKKGTSFVEFALKRIRPGLLEIPLRSSTGEKGIGGFRRRIPLGIRSQADTLFRFNLLGHNDEDFSLLPAVSGPVDSLARIQLRSFLQRFMTVTTDWVPIRN
jgi:hypothetical protein